MADQFVTAVINHCISGGVGESQLYATSGVSMQDGLRRDTGAPTIALFRQGPGESFAQGATEGYGIQVLVDSETVSGARATARDIYELLHEVVPLDGVSFGSFDVLWLRGVAPPQDVGPGPGDEKRFVVSTNYDARIKK